MFGAVEGWRSLLRNGLCAKRTKYRFRAVPASRVLSTAQWGQPGYFHLFRLSVAPPNARLLDFPKCGHEADTETKDDQQKQERLVNVVHRVAPKVEKQWIKKSRPQTASCICRARQIVTVLTIVARQTAAPAARAQAFAASLQRQFDQPAAPSG
jgi:hypothetical protein